MFEQQDLVIQAVEATLWELRVRRRWRQKSSEQRTGTLQGQGRLLPPETQTLQPTASCLSPPNRTPAGGGQDARAPGVLGGDAGLNLATGLQSQEWEGLVALGPAWTPRIFQSWMEGDVPECAPPLLSALPPPRPQTQLPSWTYCPCYLAPGQHWGGGSWEEGSSGCGKGGCWASRELEVREVVPHQC
jgi:hypothetical protein